MSKLTDRERLIAEQAVETLRAADRAADRAPHGQGLARLGACIHEKGFDLLRYLITSSASQQPEAPKKGAWIRRCSCGSQSKFKACQPRQVLTTVGHISFTRRRYYCRSCHVGSVPLDAWAGVGKRSLTGGARRMLTLAGTSWSFDLAAAHLNEFCHVQVSDDTIERV